jgi:hypothetical protein
MVVPIAFLGELVHAAQAAEAALPELVHGGREVLQRAIASAASKSAHFLESSAVKSGSTFVADSGFDRVVGQFDPARSFSGPGFGVERSPLDFRQELREELARAAHPVVEVQSREDASIRGQSGLVFDPITTKATPNRSAWFDRSYPAMR